MPKQTPHREETLLEALQRATRALEQIVDRVEAQRAPKPKPLPVVKGGRVDG